MPVHRGARILSVASILALATTALAQKPVTIQIDDPRWPKLSASEQDALIAKLRAGGALGQDDKVVYVAPKADRPSEKNVDLLKMLPLNSIICRKKNNAAAEECGAKSGAAQEACSSANRARIAKSKGACSST